MKGDFAHIMIVAGESSGDQLGAGLMGALRVQRPRVKISGLGGHAMIEAGLNSLFPMADIAVMGVAEILPRLPNLLRRINEMVAYIVMEKPDALVLIDSPEFTHRVAKKVKQVLPDLLIIVYVAPTVWAWRQGRAHKMKQYIDHILSVLPFEPRVFKNLGGPICSYVGHSAVAQLGSKKTANGFLKKYQFAKKDKIIALLPGSRISEVKRLLPIYHDTLALIEDEMTDCHLVLPTVSHLHDFIADEVKKWHLPVTLVEGEEDKLGLFHKAHTALVASGTVSLELSLIGVPMIVAYKMDKIIEFIIPRLVKTPSVVLPNLILDQPLVPEFLTRRCNPHLIAPALAGLINNNGGLRDYQLKGFEQVKSRMQPATGTPSQTAALKVLELIG